ncbi:MAG: prepilin-type N-terminal cleavage/methylation domain-containing protein, partial [Deferribacterota bacterium]|nr:prepilin-type N-terminal cleavage/methylation domain-containing protein [Deferribacterota bacterium]
MAYIFSSLLRDVKNDRKAFTVIELIVVIAIIAILLALSVIAVNKIIRREHVVSEADRLASLLKEAQKY